MKLVALLIALVILQGLDLYTTRAILARGGQELNPVMAWLMKRVGDMPALVGKGIGVVMLGYWGGDIAAATLCAVYAGVVIFNWRSMP